MAAVRGTDPGLAVADGPPASVPPALTRVAASRVGRVGEGRAGRVVDVLAALLQSPLAAGAPDGVYARPAARTALERPCGQNVRP